MKKLLVAFVLVCGMSFAQAEVSGSSRAAAEKLLQVMHTSENFNGALEQALEMQRNIIDQADLPVEKKEQALAACEKSWKTVLQNFSWEKMNGLFVDIYSQVFTEEELNGIIAFYESPAGQKFIAKQPMLMQVTMQKMQGVMGNMMKAMQQETEAVIAQIQSGKETADVN
ncbi:MAG: DUF2059 domain-containing protein [Kiritimatiellales bacterium]